jgi:hypothetical protein
MTAQATRQAVLRLIRRGQATGHRATATDAQRVIGRGDRQARRLLAAAIAETEGRTRPHVVREEA